MYCTKMKRNNSLSNKTIIRLPKLKHISLKANNSLIIILILSWTLLSCMAFLSTQATFPFTTRRTTTIIVPIAATRPTSWRSCVRRTSSAAAAARKRLIAIVTIRCRRWRICPLKEITRLIVACVKFSSRIWTLFSDGTSVGEKRNKSKKKKIFWTANEIHDQEITFDPADRILCI